MSNPFVPTRTFAARPGARTPWLLAVAFLTAGTLVACGNATSGPDDQDDGTGEGGEGGEGQGGQPQGGRGGAGGKAGAGGSAGQAGATGGGAGQPGGAGGNAGEPGSGAGGTGEPPNGGAGGSGSGGQPSAGGQGGMPASTGGTSGELVIFTGPLPPLVSKTAVAPLPASSKAAQDSLANQLKGKVAKFEIDHDPAGNVTYIKLWNKNNGSGNASDDLVSKMTTFHKLRSVHIEAQNVSDAGLAFVEKMPVLKEARFHYMDIKGKATKAFMRFLKVHPDLTTLEIKHNFSLAGTTVNELPPMPNLTRLVLDNGSAGPEVLEFLKAAKRVEDLQIHRTSMDDDQIAAFLSQMPNLRCLELKHKNKGALTLTSLRALQGHKNIRQIRVTAQSGKRPYVYEGALEYLTKIPTLKVVQLEVSDVNAPGNELPKAFLDNLPSNVVLVLESYPSGGTFLDECPPS